MCNGDLEYNVVFCLHMYVIVVEGNDRIHFREKQQLAHVYVCSIFVDIEDANNCMHHLLQWDWVHST